MQNWKDINPRLGIAYDLFGNGKTALKANIARFVSGEQVGTAAAANPQATIANNTTFNWRDLDGNGSIFNPDGSIQSGELTAGAATNANFGKGVSSGTTDPDILNGWGKRGHTWSFTAAVQHELMPRVLVTAGYYRSSVSNQIVTRNTLINRDSFDGPFCINAPANANLPGGGNYQVCNLYDLKPAFVGRVNSVRTFAKNFGGGISDVYSGFDLSVVARFKRETFIQAGINAQKRVYDVCDVLADGSMTTVTGFAPLGPQSASYADGSTNCHQVFPLRPDVKLLATTTIPFDIKLSATYQFSRGPNILASWTATNAALLAAGSTLGRNLVSTTKTVALMQPGEEYGENLNQLDVRVSKRFKMNRYTIRLDADLYNVFNSNWPFTLSNTFSTSTTASTWLRPTNVLQGRLFKLGGQFSF